MKTYNFTLKTGIKTKKMHRVRIQSVTMLKNIYWIQYTKKNRSRKNEDKDGKVMYKLMNNAVYSKMMEDLRNRIGVGLANSEKKYLRCTSKPSYMSHKIFENNLVEIQKSKDLLKLNKLLN